jgi:hypothetical protein
MLRPITFPWEGSSVATEWVEDTVDFRTISQYRAGRWLIGSVYQRDRTEVTQLRFFVQGKLIARFTRAEWFDLIIERQPDGSLTARPEGGNTPPEGMILCSVHLNQAMPASLHVIATVPPTVSEWICYTAEREETQEAHHVSGDALISPMVGGSGTADDGITRAFDGETSPSSQKGNDKNNLLAFLALIALRKLS